MCWMQSNKCSLQKDETDGIIKLTWYGLFDLIKSNIAFAKTPKLDKIKRTEIPYDALKKISNYSIKIMEYFVSETMV